jgi:hypothetical protein
MDFITATTTHLPAETWDYDCTIRNRETARCWIRANAFSTADGRRSHAEAPVRLLKIQRKSKPGRAADNIADIPKSLKEITKVWKDGNRTKISLFRRSSA